MRSHVARVLRVAVGVYRVLSAADELPLVSLDELRLVESELGGPRPGVDRLSRRGLANASPNVLSQRLAELEGAGVIGRRKLPPPAGARVYELTAWGRELEDTVMSLGRWAARSPTPPTRAPVRSADSVILALRARFDSRAAGGLRTGYELRLGEDRFLIDVADERLEVARGEAHQADATIDTDPDTIAGVLWAGRSLADAQRLGTMTIEGDQAAVERFVQLFPMPESAVAASPA